MTITFSINPADQITLCLSDFNITYTASNTTSDRYQATVTLNGSDTVFNPVLNGAASLTMKAPTTFGTYPVTVKINDIANSSFSDVRTFNLSVPTFTELATNWTLGSGNGLNTANDLLYTMIDGQVVLIIASRGNNTIKFFKRVSGAWSDMGSSWNITSGLNGPRGILFATIDCKQVLGVGNITASSPFPTTLQFYERVNNNWVSLSTGWTLSGFSLGENIKYVTINGQDVLVVADRSNNQIKFFQRLAGSWVDLGASWTLTSNINNPVGLHYTTIDNIPVLVVSNFGSNTVRFYQRDVASWTEQTTWALSTNLDGPGSIQFTQIGALKVLIVANQKASNSVRFYIRTPGTWVEQITGWTLTNLNNIFNPYSVLHTVIDSTDVIVVSNEGDGSVRFYNVCDGCFTIIQGLSTNPTCPCANQPFTVNWVVGTANGSDHHTASVNFNGNIFVSDYPNTGGAITLITPTASDYLLTLTVQDRLYSDCIDTKTIKLYVSDCGILPSCSTQISDFNVPVSVVVNQPFTANWNVNTIEGSDQHIATISFNGYNFTSSHPNTGGAQSFTAPTIASDYPITLFVQDAAHPDCSDLRTILVHVIPASSGFGCNYLKLMIQS